MARVAVVQGWAAEEYLRTKFPEIIVDPVPDTVTGLRKVSFGLVDALVSELPVATECMEKEAITNLKIAGETGFTYHLGVGVRKDWPELLGILEKALATVTPEERTAIYKRWGSVRDFEAEFRTPNGMTRLGLVSGGVLALREGTHVIATVRDITERKRVETVRQRLNAQLLQTEDEERRRIARELHDTTAQHLGVIQMNLTRLRKAALAEADARLLAGSLALTAQSVQEIRTLSYLLPPPLLDELGLAGALGDYAAGFAKRSGLLVEVDTAGCSGRLPREQEMALFRVAQASSQPGQGSEFTLYFPAARPATSD